MAVKSITTKEVFELSKNGRIHLIDVREVDEFEEFSSPLAVNIALSEFDIKKLESITQKHEPIYLICRSGRRSLNAGIELESLGYTDLYNVEGGMLDWRACGVAHKVINVI